MIYFPRHSGAAVSVKEVRQTLRPVLQECGDTTGLADQIEAMTDAELAAVLLEWQQEWDRAFP